MLDPLVQISTLGAALAVMGGAWVVSIPLRDASIADIAWGLAFVAIAIAALVAGDAGGGRGVLIALLVVVWGLRLAGWIAYRHDGEDPRYAAMRERHGDEFVRRSLWSVFGLQALIAWIVSAPIQVAATDGSPETLGILAWAGFAAFFVGLAFEGIADAQLERFKRNPLNEGAVLASGLWRYSRHPNYFGDACVWWGIWLIALETGSAWWTAIGPALMTFLLLRVSGVALTERTIAERRPGYAEYARSTSAFVPRRPRRRHDTRR
jgi:steroid 5-alpha reductase family enzyme